MLVARGAAAARRPRDGVPRSRDRRAGRQRPARAVRLLPRDAGVPAADRRRRDHVRVQPSLEVPSLDARAGDRFCAARRCRRRFTWSPASSMGGAPLAGPAERAAARPADSAARRQLRRRRRSSVEPPGMTVEEWLARHGQGRDAARVAVGAAGRGRAEPVARRGRRRRRSCGCSPRCSRPILGSALVLPLNPLHEMYAVPARDFIGRTAARCDVSAGARHIGGGRVDGVDVRGEPLTAGAVVAAVPWFALRGLFGAVAARRAADDLAAAAGDGVEADRDGESLVRPAGDGRSLRRTARAGRCSGCSTSGVAFGESASHLSLVVERRRPLVGEDQRGAVALAAREVAAALPARAMQWPIRAHRHPREAGDVLAGARRAAAPGHADRPSRACSSPATGSTPGFRAQSRARW